MYIYYDKNCYGRWVSFKYVCVNKGVPSLTFGDYDSFENQFQPILAIMLLSVVIVSRAIHFLKPV